MQAESVQQAGPPRRAPFCTRVDRRLHVSPCTCSRTAVDVPRVPLDVCAMTNAWRSARCPVLAAGALTVLAACERANQPSSRADTTLPPTVGAVESLPVAQVVRRWDTSAGPVLLVRDDSLTRAIYPTVRQLDSTAVLDEALVRGFIADAAAADGFAGSLRIRGFAPVDEECAVWPALVLSADSARDWTVAFQHGVSTPITLRPIESFSSPDSARLAAQLTRLAASLPNDTARAFRGLPFVIRAAHNFAPDAGVEAVVAEIVRRVNVEANPREETLLLIAERDGGSGEWRVAYSERASGDEIHVERATPLAAVRLGSPALPTLVLERAGADWIAYALIQRQRDGRWRESWESAYSGC